MKLLGRLRGLFKSRPITPEEAEDEAEAKRLQYESDSIRASQRTMAGQNYQSGRESRP
jgi:hypothetical protein